MTQKGKKNSEDLKNKYKDNLKKLALAEQEMATLRDTYVPYFKENELFLCRCYSDLFARLRHNRSWNNVFYSLYFDRSKNWFDYDKLFKELNSLFGTHYKILRYLSGYRKARLVSFESKEKFPGWTIEWGALYQLFCLLRIINVTNYGNWKKYHAKNPLDNWQDVIFIFLTKFHESKYGLLKIS